MQADSPITPEMVKRGMDAQHRLIAENFDGGEIAEIVIDALRAALQVEVSTSLRAELKTAAVRLWLQS